MAHWKLLLSEPILVTSWITVHKNRYKIEDDECIDNYYIVKRNDFVLIVATHQDKLLLVKQYRPATDRDYLALPAGFLNEGESPVECAKCLSE